MIKELLALKEQLETASKTDALTDLPNRRGLNESLDNENLRYERNKKSFCIILYDVDHFKEVNDNHGNDAGDHVLVEVANVFRKVAIGQDIVGRWGGEEFLALLPETDIEGGLVIAEKFRSKIELNRFEFNKIPFPMTMSFGFSEFNSDDSTIDQCIKHANQCLLKAKEAGKNKIVS